MDTANTRWTHSTKRLCATWMSDENIAVVLALVLFGLDVNFGPVWLLLAQASVLSLGWPKPIPGSRWSRRTS